MHRRCGAILRPHLLRPHLGGLKHTSGPHPPGLPRALEGPCSLVRSPEGPTQRRRRESTSGGSDAESVRG
eukprot:9467486-Pyramimonas_sp.AAC.1